MPLLLGRGEHQYPPDSDAVGSLFSVLLEFLIEDRKNLAPITEDFDKPSLVPQCARSSASARSESGSLEATDAGCAAVASLALIRATPIAIKRSFLMVQQHTALAIILRFNSKYIRPPGVRESA